MTAAASQLATQQRLSSSQQLLCVGVSSYRDSDRYSDVTGFDNPLNIRGDNVISMGTITFPDDYPALSGGDLRVVYSFFLLVVFFLNDL